MGDEDERYEAAVQQVERRLGLAVHWTAYVAVNVLIAVSGGVDLSAGHVWGWAIGLAAHSWHVAGWGAGWKERLVAREVGLGSR